MGMKLFEGDDDGIEKLDNIEINKEFARRYEHNKKREDLQKLEEMEKKGLVDDSDDEGSSEEEEEEEDLNPSSNLKFFDGLIKIKKGDPVLNNKDAKLFDSESDSETNSESKDKKKKKKPMYLKDVVSKHLMEEGPEFGDEEDDEEEEKKVKTYSEEQEDLRKEFLNAVKGDDVGEEEDLFKVKENGKKGDVLADDDDEFAKKLDEFFGEDEKLDERTVFLKDYFRNKMWRDDKKGKRDDVEEVELSEDEEEIEKQEDYERQVNFRFEENAGDRVLGHSRKVEGSVRKKANARKLQRDRKEERMAQAEEERKEELKRLKNLKKKEMREKIEKIKETAGIGEDGVCLLDVDDLEEEFDPDEHDRKMKKAFGDAYYDTDDMDPEFGSDKDEDDGELGKPDFYKEDELLGLSKGWDNVDGPRDGFLSTREKLLKAIENEGNHEQTTDDNKENADDDDVAEEGKRKKKRKRTNTIMKTVREELMEEYYKLDYEDTIGDLKTRFKYRPVKAKRFGLSPEEMLAMEEKELNQYVSLKKLAPYREKDWKVPRLKTLELKETLKGKRSDVPKAEKKRKFDNKEKLDGRTDGKKEKEEVSNGDTSSKQSRRSRRRKQQAEYKLSEARLKAYSTNPSVSNSKKK